MSPAKLGVLPVPSNSKRSAMRLAGARAAGRGSGVGDRDAEHPEGGEEQKREDRADPHESTVPPSIPSPLFSRPIIASAVHAFPGDVRAAPTMP